MSRLKSSYRPFLILVFLSLGLSACVANHIERGEYPAGHVWATDMAAKDVVSGDFALKGRVSLGYITRHAKNLPASADRALEISLKENGFLAASETEAEFRLDIRMVRIEKVDAIPEKGIPDSYVAQLQYILLSIPDAKVIREVSVLSVYDLGSYKDSVLVKCEACAELKLASNAKVDATAEPESIGDLVAPEVPEYTEAEAKTVKLRQSSGCRTDECYQREQAVRAGVGLAIMGILTAATGDNYFSAYNGYVLGVYNSPYAPHQRTQTYTGPIVIGTSESVRRGRPMQANIQAALEILAREKL